MLNTPETLIDHIATLRRRLDNVRRATAIFSNVQDVPEALRAEEYVLEQELAKSEDMLTVEYPSSSEIPPQRAGHVFVIMPFRDPFDSYYRDVIRPAVTDVKYEILRSDEIYSPTAFLQTIWDQIIKADVIISEMTSMNPNVLYELGLCHAISKKVIMITQEMQFVPSDLRHINCIVYDTRHVNWADKLRNSIQRMLLFKTDEHEDHIVLRPKATIDNTAFFERLTKEREFLTGRLSRLEQQNSYYSRYVTDLKSKLISMETRIGEHLLSDSAYINTAIERIEDNVTIYMQALPNCTCTVEFVVVDEGSFIFGTGSNAREIELSRFYISRYSITNRQFCEFLNQEGNRVEGGTSWVDLAGRSHSDRCGIVEEHGKFGVREGFEEFPVTYVNYYGAAAFCEWAGGTLPTAEQWEKAVRGVDGREYPWGNQPPTSTLANYQENGWDRDVAPIDVREKAAGQSPYGVVQGIGNVWHWTQTYYPDRDVQAVRGGSFFDFRLGNRSVYRFVVQPNGPDLSQGFLMMKRFMKTAR